MSTDEKTNIETLIPQDLARAQKRFDEFLDLFADEKANLIQSQSRLANLQKMEREGTTSARETTIERNQITSSFIQQITYFRSQLSNYFDVGDSKKLFDNIKNRNDIISKALEARVTDKQYIVGKQLKDGNSSIIYKLSKINTDQEAVALVLKSPELSPETKEDFIKLLRLRHRNIIKFNDRELDSFPFFMISEYVSGVNLVKVIAITGARPMAQLVDWMYQLADALDYVRHKGVLHTNVRPSKIFIDEELNVMISPFDFNQKNKDERTFTRYQDVCLYGSPELLLRDGEPLSLAEMCISDQYSMGLIAYKVLTGQDLFEGNSIVDILKNRHQFSSNKAYRAAKLSVFPANKLGQILRKLLNEDATQRFSNLHEVVKALHIHTHFTKENISNKGIRESYRRCLGKNRMFISDFYNLLFKRRPEVKPYFNEPKRQLSMMQMAVDLLIDIDEKKPQLNALMKNENHQNFPLTLFEDFIDILLEVVKENDLEWADIQLEWQLLREKTINVIKEARESV